MAPDDPDPPRSPGDPPPAPADGGAEAGAERGGDGVPRAEADPGASSSWVSDATQATRRAASAFQDRLGDALGEGIGRLGGGIETLGEGVSKLGERAGKVPLVGAGVRELGEGLSQVGESLHTLPRMARTVGGRVLVRSLLVGFVLVFAWISAIVALQLQGTDLPDFRPLAERILVELSAGTPGRLKGVYDAASPRFQEMVREERFVDDMQDMDLTVGRFLEIAAVNDTIVTDGPAGRIGRVSLTVQFQRATCKASVSFHWVQGGWRLLGVGVDLPPELPITNAQRARRIAATPDVKAAVEALLAALRADRAAEVWQAATPLFRQSVTEAAFVELEQERRRIVGRNKRLVDVTEARVIAGAAGFTANVDALVEHERAVVRATVTFERGSKAEPWRLASYKVVIPPPRADPDGRAEAPEAPAADGGADGGPRGDGGLAVDGGAAELRGASRGAAGEAQLRDAGP